MTHPEGWWSVRPKIGQGAGVCRTVAFCFIALALGVAAFPGEISAQARGTVTARAQVISAAPGRAGIEGAAELVRSRQRAHDSVARAETPFAVVTVRWLGSWDAGRDSRQAAERQRAESERPRLVASIEFLRN
jgi:hypothetical protein